MKCFHCDFLGVRRLRLLQKHKPLHHSQPSYPYEVIKKASYCFDTL